MGTRIKNQIVLKKQKCGGFLFKNFEQESLIRSTNVALAGKTVAIGEVAEPDAQIITKLKLKYRC
jgi:hypothetical protein